MKKLVLSALLLVGIAGFASAQTTSNQASTTQNKKGSQSKSKTTKNKKVKTAKSSDLDQRKMYDWESGQTATPTGEQATGTNSGGFISSKKDTSTLKKNQKQKK